MKHQLRNKIREKAGFTLVELIVVIAILGILSGIGVVGYQGYIKKANEAADQQLLGYINSAFAAACLENGEDMQDRTSASVSLNSDKTVASVNPYDDSFQKYYAGNENSKFKVFDSLVFDAAKHVFVDMASAGEVTIAYGDGVVKISSEDAKKLADSTFITAGDLGVENLLNKVNDVATFASRLTGTSAMDTVTHDPVFREFVFTTLGIDTTQEGWQLEYEQVMDGIIDQMKATGLTQEQAENKMTANIAVMYAASNATKMSASEITNLLSNTGAKGKITTDLGSNPGKALSEAALAYGMYTAYAYSTGNQTLIDQTSNPGTVIDNLEDPNFLNYMKSEQGTTDLNGYLSALNMINSSKGDSNAVGKVVINGFNDRDLISLLNQAVGKN